MGTGNVPTSVTKVTQSVYSHASGFADRRRAIKYRIRITFSFAKQSVSLSCGDQPRRYGFHPIAT